MCEIKYQQNVYMLVVFFSRVPSHVQGTVLEPCPRLDVQLNKSMDPLGRAVDGTESTSDVVCRLFGTTITTVTRRKSQAQHICAESLDPSP